MLALGGCGGDEPAAPDPASVASLRVVPSQLVLRVPQGAGLRGVLLNAAGDTVFGRPILWSSSAPFVAAVDSTGMVVARLPGSGVVRAATEGFSDSATVVVEARFRSLAAGGRHTCGLTTDSLALCWGDNVAGQLGTGTGTDALFPSQVRGRVAFLTIATGASHSCGETSAGVFCWGNNSRGQVGVAPVTSPGATAVPGAASLSKLALGDTISCGIDAGGNAACWGGTARPLAGGLTLSMIAHGTDHACGLTTAGAAYCWGGNNAGQLGDSTITFRATPVPVYGGQVWRTLAAGFRYTCALDLSGAAYCWGIVLGGGGATTRIPTAVGGGVTFESLTGGTSHACGLSASLAYCWGFNLKHQLGDTTATLNRTTPVPVAGSRQFAALTTGGEHTCGLTAAGEVFCWGDNGDGQLGDGGTTLTSGVPRRVFGGP